MRKKLLLLYPGEFYAGKWGRYIELKPHMIYVYSFLKDLFDVSVVDLENELFKPKTERDLVEFKKRALRRVLAIEADYVAISCWSSLNYLSSKFLAQKIKQKKPQTIIIVGGYHPTFVPQDFEYEGTPFDHVIRGEIQNILKLFSFKTNAGLQTYEIRPSFRTYPYYKAQKTVGIFLGSGCPFQCHFCMEYKRQWRRLPVSKAIERVLEINNDMAPAYIAIFDACFGLDKTWRRAFLAELIKTKIESYFWFETRVDLIEEEDIELMSELNLKVDFGIDSFSTTMLNIMNKTRNPASYLQKFVTLSRKCSELKILHDAFLIFNHPGETADTYTEFLQFLNETVSPVLAGGYLRVFFQRYSFFPGSYIFNHIDDFKAEYGTEIQLPSWWKQKENHFLASRAVVPSKDGAGKPFTVPLDQISVRIKEFNSLSKEKPLWERLHAFNL
ncbi:MAG: cobalamin-dependent protein [Desulfobacterales bacterium]